MERFGNFDSSKEIVALVIACDPDTRHPDRAARKFARSIPGVKLARSVNGAPSPELTITDQDTDGLYGLVYNVRETVRLHPKAQVLVIVFGHAGCKRNPQKDPEVQKAQIINAGPILHGALAARGMGDFRGTMDVATCYQPLAADGESFPPEETVVLDEGIGVINFGSSEGEG